MTPIERLKKVWAGNKEWPLIIEGAALQDSPDSATIPATIPERDLHSDTIAVKPYLIIDGLDRISGKEQEKFITLLKDRRTGMRKLPAGVHIVIPVRYASNLSDKIKNLALLWELK